ncbi:ATP-binding protein [Sinorhizobium medicae]
MRQALHCLLHDRGSGAVTRCLDNGRGLPADAQAGAFDRFFWRGGYSRASFSGGSGLGLPIVGAIARVHGGDASNQYQWRTRRGSRAQEEGHTRGAA